MRIVVLAESLSEQMGYSTRFFPKALADEGHEVHLVTSNTQSYFNSPEYKSIFEKFIGPGIVACGVKSWNGCTLHRLPVKIWPRKAIGIKGLVNKIAELKPDIVHSMGLFTEINYEVALAKPFLGYKFFLECHVHASVFPPFVLKVTTPQRWLYWHVYRPMVGKLVSAATEKCWAISEDAAEIAHEYLGYNKQKIEVRSLGTDTTLFTPWYELPMGQREKWRRECGFDNHHIVCIYTGRNQESKDPLILARAVDALVKQGHPYRAVFIGDGATAYMEALKVCQGAVLLPFVPVDDLARYYQMADIGVWPKQESTSQMDAAACGLPLVLSNRVRAQERIEGNALVYEEPNVDDMASTLLALKDPQLRRRMGEVGAKRMQQKCSWKKIAQESIQAYSKALGRS